MATAKTIDPKLQQLYDSINGAFAGGPGPAKDFNVGTGINSDASQFASSMLAAYHAGAVANPSKAFKPTAGKAFNTLTLDNPQAVVDKAWWNDVLTVVTDMAPVVINALSKDYQPPQPSLKDVIDGLPAARKNDKDWTDFATQLLLTAAETTVHALGGTKDFSDEKNIPDIPQPPAGKDKGWFDDVCHFVSQAAPVAIPIVMSLI
jgi:hypothetical protein